MRPFKVIVYKCPDTACNNCGDYNSSARWGICLSCNLPHQLIDEQCQILCGNGLPNPGETCDDTNSATGDGCSNCLEEAGWTCTGFGPGLCSQNSVCGNGLIETTPENCDDGNSDSNDGCSDDCLEELGFTCEDEPSVCTIVCGDSLKVGPETCDDGNQNDFDGCSA